MNLKANFQLLSLWTLTFIIFWVECTVVKQQVETADYLETLDMSRRINLLLIPVLTASVVILIYVTIVTRNVQRERAPTTVQAKDHNINIFKGKGLDFQCECVPFKVNKPVIENPTICIYEPHLDMVSKFLKIYGTWEGSILEAVGHHLGSNPGSIFIDIGSHVGTYTLYANALGYKAIAVDPLRNNLERLSKSLKLVNQDSNVILLWNAVSNVRENVMLRADNHNIGSTHIRNYREVGYNKSMANYSVQTILMDDLVDEFNLDGKTVIMKMDVEGMEHKALMGASLFFKRVRVCFVGMEAEFHRNKWRYEMILEFMKDLGFEIYFDPWLRKKTTNTNELDMFFAKTSCMLT